MVGRMRCRQCVQAGAFTLVELIVVVAAVSVISSVGVVAVGNIQDAARESKLEADVESINRSIALYQANGGVLNSTVAPTADDAIAKLKTRADNSTASVAIGFTGSFLDVRTIKVDQTSAEASAGKLRAVWNPTPARFTTARSGGAGISQFKLDESLAGATVQQEARTLNLAASPREDSDRWVWNYEDGNLALSQVGAPGLALAEAPAPVKTWNGTANASSSSPTVTPLVATVSAPTVTYATAGGDMVFTGSNPSAYATVSVSPSTASSSILTSYGTGSTPGTAYASPGVSLALANWNSTSLVVNAQAISGEPNYSNSTVASGTATVTPLALLAPIISPGGASINFAYGPVTVSLTVSSDTNLPVNYRMFYTTDGSTPTTSSTPYSGSFFVTPADLNSGNSTFGTVKAIVAGPSGYEAWFTSSTATEIYSGRSFASAIPAGLLLGSLEFLSNVEIDGSVTYVTNADGTPPDLSGNANIQILRDVLLPGVPGNFEDLEVDPKILGGTFLANGTQLDPNPDPRKAIELSGTYDQTVNAYTYEIPPATTITGKVYANIPPIRMPTITIPTGLPNQTASSPISSNTTLAQGNYTNNSITVKKGKTLTLGSANTTTQYIFNGDLTLEDNSSISILGNVTITFANDATLTLNKATTVGNSSSPGSLRVDFAGSDGTAILGSGNNSITFYGQIVAPERTVDFSGGPQLNLTGSITAEKVILKNNLVINASSLTPIYGGYY